ncbi:hypothetical protein [Chitinophaga caseinilytica]|uniref:DUF4401 domain-containing protein n=1 Tax=Chitinophaga caseinilytica TaxID=2267521 RepID=A0ABZ2Z1P0_9BACT
MTNYMHTDDLLPNSFGDSNCRADLLPKWMRGLATIIVMLSLLFLIIGLSMLFRSAFGVDEGVMLICSILGVCCGVAAAGLLMESDWAVWWSLLTSAGVFLVFITLLAYDLFFYRMKIWTLVGIDVFVLTITLLYLRGLWKIRRDWDIAPQSEVPDK